MARLDFDWDSADRFVEFAYADGQTYRVPKFCTLTAADASSAIEGADSDEAAASAIIAMLFDRGGFCYALSELPQDFRDALLREMKGDSLGK